MCTVVVALAYTSVLVIVLVHVSVVVTLPASTPAGASRATSAAVAVVRRICTEYVIVLSRGRLTVDCTELCAEVKRGRGPNAQWHALDLPRLYLFPRESRWFATGRVCFRIGLFEVGGVVCDGGLQKARKSRLRQAWLVLRERGERALLER